jgi:hypothetical protein
VENKDKNKNNMIKYFSMIVDKDKPSIFLQEALYQLGKFYYDNNKHSLDIKMVETYVNKLIEKKYVSTLVIDLCNYYLKNNDIESFKKYHLLHIENNCVGSMLILGEYYENKEINYELMKKYYLLCINDKSQNDDVKSRKTHCLNNLGVYYRDIEKNTELMLKYFLMCIDINFKNDGYEYVCNNLAEYYENIKDYNNFIKYCLLNEKNIYANVKLARYYKEIKNYNKMKEFCIKILLTYYKNNKYYNEISDMYLNYITTHNDIDKNTLYTIIHTDSSNNFINGYLKHKFDINIAKEHSRHLDKANKIMLDLHS